MKLLHLNCFAWQIIVLNSFYGFVLFFGRINDTWGFFSWEKRKGLSINHFRYVMDAMHICNFLSYSNAWLSLHKCYMLTTISYLFLDTMNVTMTCLSHLVIPDIHVHENKKKRSSMHFMYVSCKANNNDISEIIFGGDESWWFQTVFWLKLNRPLFWLWWVLVQLTGVSHKVTFGTTYL